MFHRVHSHLLIVLVAGSLLCSSGRVAFAQAADKPETTAALAELNLEDLLNIKVVTASGGAAEERDLSSANVMVYQRTEIARHGWTSVAEVLAHVPGLYVIDDLVTPAVSVRGTSGGYDSATRIIKVMINGVQVNFRPDMTAFLGPEYIPIDAVERIEIAKGPLSALYGSNAFLATVNVITVKPVSGLHGRVGGAGDFLAVRGGNGAGTVTYGSDQVNLLLAYSGSYFDRSGLSVSKTFPKQDPTLPIYAPFFSSSSKDDITQPQSLYFNLQPTSKRIGTVTLQGGLQDLDSKGEFQSYSALTHESRYAIRNVWSDLRWEKEWAPKWTSYANAGWSQGAPTDNDLQVLSADPTNAYRRRFRYQALDTRAGLNWNATHWLNASASGEYATEWQRVLYYSEIYRVAQGTHAVGDVVDILTPGQSTDQTITDLAGHAQLVLKDMGWAPKLRLIGDVRLDKSNLYPHQLSWRTAIAYKWKKGVSSRLVAGQAFQGSSAVLLFAMPGFGNVGNVIGNRAVLNQKPLLPQTVTSAEAIVNLRLSDVFEVVPSVFVQQIDHSIDFVNNGIGYLAINSSSRESVGVELTALAVRKPFTLQVAGAYQWQLKSGNSDDPVEQLSAPPMYPAFWTMASLNAEFPKIFLQANATVRWVGPRGPTEQNLALNDSQPYTLASYVRVDLALATIGLHLVGKNVTQIGAVARNLTDERHSEPGPIGADLPALGRTIEMSLRQNF
jgi:outer membrane receptor protein involved in Fe transport